MSELIDIISKQDKLLDFMERYHLMGLREATEEQLREYIEEVIGYGFHQSNNREPCH